MSLSTIERPSFSAPGLKWMNNGQSVISGELLDAFRRVDQYFVKMGSQWEAEEYRFPIFIPAYELNKLDYFRSFPHLVTFPVTLDHSEENLESFRSCEPVDDHGCMHMTRTAEIRDVLTPAACYHFYIALQGQTFNRPKYVTTLATCFRKEVEYHPLQRQWNFSMREIVCIGTQKEVQDYLRSFQETMKDLFRQLALPITFENATDPFFKPSTSPKYAMQKLDPVKTEMIFDNRLAIGSFNYHRSHFGETFALDRDGAPSSTGCVAFGLERWLYALLMTYGHDCKKFPI